MDEKCPQCNQDMIVEFAITANGLSVLKKAECKEHGRIWTHIWPAVCVRQPIKHTTPLICKECHKPVKTLFVTNALGLCCKECADGALTNTMMKLEQEIKEMDKRYDAQVDN